MSKSGIEWTEETWNPVTGCSKVSPGCANCYAEREALGRLSGKKGYPGLPWTKNNAEMNLTLHPDRLLKPVRAKRPRTYFVNSMSDLFHENIPNEFIAAVFGSMAAAPQHTFQVLTKRAERMRDWFTWVEEVGRGGRLECCWQALRHEVNNHPLGDSGPMHMKYAADPDGPWPLPNVWLGVSAEDQERADERIPTLLDTPAAVRFVSAEPLLGPIDYVYGEHVDWVIVGGESGLKAREMDIAWVRSIVVQCADAGVACFVKQLGAKPVGVWGQENRPFFASHYRLSSRKGGNPAEWPSDIRVREMPA